MLSLSLPVRLALPLLSPSLPLFRAAPDQPKLNYYEAGLDVHLDPDPLQVLLLPSPSLLSRDVISC